MDDSRIDKFLQAVKALRRGEYAIDLPSTQGDALDALGAALSELAASMQQREGQLQQIIALTETINSGLTLDDVLTYIYDTFRSVIPYERIGFALLNEDCSVATARWAKSEAGEMRLGGGFSAPMASSSLQRVMERGIPRILNDLEAYLSEHPNSESTALVVKEGMRSSLTCPLIAHGTPIGFIFFSSKRKDCYKDVHVGIFKQIAGQVAMIVEKANLYQNLVELNQTKNRFLGIAAHDLRNPLSIQHGFLALVLKGQLGPLNEKQRQALDIIDEASRSMLNLVNDLLDVNAIESGRLEVNLQPVEVVPFLQRSHQANQFLAAAKNIELDLEIEGDPGVAIMDPARVTQVLSNLITNAIKFSYPESRIIMGASRHDSGHRFYVRDEGKGIPKDEQQHLFSEFGKTSVTPTGGENSTGLGLAIVRKLVEAHGGSVHVDSQEGRGSTFSFIIPNFD